MKKLLKILVDPKLPSILISLFIGCILWMIPSFIPHNYELWTTQNTPFTEYLYSFIGISPFVAEILGLVFTLIISTLLVQFNNNFSFIPIRNHLLFFFFMLLSGSNINLHSFNFSHLGILFLLITLWQLFSIYDKKQAVFISFNIGFYIAIGSFFTIELLLFLPLLLIGIYSLNSFTLKTFLACMIGLASPIAAVTSYMYLIHNNLDINIQSYFNQFEFSINIPTDIFSIIYFIMLSALSILSILNILNHSSTEKIKRSRMLGVIISGFIFFSLLFLFKSNNSPTIFTIVIFFSSILYAHLFSLKTSLFIRILFLVQLAVYLLYYFSRLFSIAL